MRNVHHSFYEENVDSSLKNDRLMVLNDKWKEGLITLFDNEQTNFWWSILQVLTFNS